MGIEQTMDFGISTETKNSRQKKDRGWQTIDLDLQRSKKNWGRKILGFGQTMDLMLVNKYKEKRQKNKRYWINYIFGLRKI